MCACPGSVHEKTVSSSGARNRLEATPRQEQLPRSGPSRLIHIVPFKKPEVVRCRIHQNKESGRNDTRLGLLLPKQVLSYLSYPPRPNNRGILKHVQSLPPRHQHRLSVHSVQQRLESHKLLPSPVRQGFLHIYPYIKVVENKQIAHRRMVAGPGIRGIIAK